MRNLTQASNIAEKGGGGGCGVCLPDGNALKREVMPSFYFSFEVPLLWLIHGQSLKKIMLFWLLFRGGGGMTLIKRAENDLGTHLHKILNHDFLMCMVGAHYII